MTLHNKYQEVNGIRKYNPAYVVPPSAPAAAVPFINQSTALPVIAVPVSAVVQLITVEERMKKFHIYQHQHMRLL